MAVDPIIARGTQPVDISNSLVEIARMREAQARTQAFQQQNALAERRYNDQQAQMDEDDAEWEQAYAAKDWGRMARIDPQTTQILWSREQAMNPQMSQGIKIGQYNPGDYTPQSWSQFLQTKDPSVLARQYAPPSPPNQTVIQLPQGQAAFNPRTGQTTLLSERGDQRAAEAADAAATVSAQESVKAKIEANKAKVTGEKTYAAFDSAMTAHEGALAGTETGPVAGRIPAVTSGQQKAVASKAALAPILKQIFRSAGEGIFTDKDQQLLLEMMPDRTLTPEAREFASQNVRNIVKAKLGIQTDAPVKIETDDQYDMLPSGVQFVGPDGVTRRKP